MSIVSTLVRSETQMLSELRSSVKRYAKENEKRATTEMAQQHVV